MIAALVLYPGAALTITGAVLSLRGRVVAGTVLATVGAAVLLTVNVIIHDWLFVAMYSAATLVTFALASWYGWPKRRPR